MNRMNRLFASETSHCSKAELSPRSNPNLDKDCLERGLPALPAVSFLIILFGFVSFFGFGTPEVQAKSKPDFEKKLAKGYHQLQTGDTEKAINFFAKKASKYPQSGACHTALGRALKRRGKLNEARAEFKKATQVEPQFAEGYYYLGVSLEQDKEWKEAAEAFQKYVDLEPDQGKRKVVQDRVRHCKNQI